MNELFVKRKEEKYLISKEIALKCQKNISKILNIDDHSINNQYTIRNVYFDTVKNKDYNDKLSGIEIRKKIRIRVYNIHDKNCKLELKQKSNDLQYKISIWITKEDAIELIKCNYSVLTKYFKISKDAILFYKTMRIGCYKPVCYIEYVRTAYTYPAFNTRITFDNCLKSSESNFDIFDENIVCNIANERYVILEVKYNGQLVEIVRKLLKPFNLNKESISKYCISRPIYNNLINY